MLVTSPKLEPVYREIVETENVARFYERRILDDGDISYRISLERTYFAISGMLQTVRILTDTPVYSDEKHVYYLKGNIGAERECTLYSVEGV